MPFPSKPQYDNIRDKLNAERDLHRGRDYAAFDELVRLHEENKGRLPLTVIAYLFNVGSVNTVKSWKRQRKELGLPNQKEGTHNNGKV